jgi:2-isopropylmalate synthase
MRSALAKAAHDEGARWVVLCDTNGGTLPHEVEAIVAEVVKLVPGDHVGIHAHNDTEQAVANSFAAVRGARQIQGTLNGLGERCGNANLVSIIPTLKLKPESPSASRSAFRTRSSGLPMPRARLDEMLNRAPNRHAPYVGESVRDQGRHPCLRDPQGSGHLRAHVIPRRSATGAVCWCRTRPENRMYGPN